MDARELRIGNLFIDNKTKTIISVIGLTEEIITFSGHFKNDWQAEPIPLTEEWLLKFGFESYNQKSYKLNIILDNKDTFLVFYSHSGGNIMMSINDPKNDYNLIREIKHVHQLQNLYFALTGEELEITKTK